QVENIPLESYVEKEEQTVELKAFLGNWQGIITQPANDQVPNYVFSMYFNKIEGGLLKGYSRIEVPENDAFGVTRIQAWLSGNSLNFEEVQVYRQKNYLGYKWCKKYGQVRLDSKEEQLQGNWLANNCTDHGQLIMASSVGKFNYYDNRLSAKIPYDDFLKQLEKGSTEESILDNGPIQLDLDPIAFGFGNAVLTNEARNYLSSKRASLLKKYPQYQVAIHGYTDSIGEDGYNLMLSEKRAQAIWRFLIDSGVDPDQVSYQGMGEANPIASNSTPEGRATNRRVEFIMSQKPSK
ncbi:MAG: OmpA family protein, partial [Bacteroidota bacterium]